MLLAFSQQRNRGRIAIEGLFAVPAATLSLAAVISAERDDYGVDYFAAAGRRFALNLNLPLPP